MPNVRAMARRESPCTASSEPAGSAEGVRRNWRGPLTRVATVVGLVVVGRFWIQERPGVPLRGWLLTTPSAPSCCSVHRAAGGWLRPTALRSAAVPPETASPWCIAPVGPFQRRPLLVRRSWAVPPLAATAARQWKLPGKDPGHLRVILELINPVRDSCAGTGRLGRLGVLGRDREVHHGQLLNTLSRSWPASVTSPTPAGSVLSRPTLACRLCVLAKRLRLCLAVPERRTVPPTSANPIRFSYQARRR